MPYNRPQTAEIETILAAAEKIAKRTNTQFIVNDQKRDAFIRFGADLSKTTGNEDGAGRRSVQSTRSIA